MQVSDLLEYRDKIIEKFRNGTFLSEHLKTSNATAYDYVLEDVNNFIQKIESMSENINLNLFQDFFEILSPEKKAKMLINTKNPNEDREIVAEIEHRILDLKGRIEEMTKRKKNKSADETLKIIEEILDQNKNAQRFFPAASKVDKRKSKSKLEENISKRTKLRRQRLNTIKEKKNKK